MSTPVNTIEAWGDMFTAFEHMCDNLRTETTAPTRDALVCIGVGLWMSAPTSAHVNSILTLCARHRIVLNLHTVCAR